MTIVTNPETYGERFRACVGEYLKANKLTSLGQINGKILAELSQDFHDKNTVVTKRQLKLASDEEWLKSIENDTAMQGIDVRRELGKAQFWCKTRQRQCTRKFFENWLLKAEATVTRSYEGATSRPKVEPPKPRYTLDQPVPSWPMLLRNYLTLSEEETDRLCNLDWKDLPTSIRQQIINAA